MRRSQETLFFPMSFMVLIISLIRGIDMLKKEDCYQRTMHHHLMFLSSRKEYVA